MAALETAPKINSTNAVYKIAEPNEWTITYNTEPWSYFVNDNKELYTKINKDNSTYVTNVDWGPILNNVIWSESITTGIVGGWPYDYTSKVTNEYTTNVTGHFIISNEYTWGIDLGASSPRETKKREIRSRLAIVVKSRGDLPFKVSEQEQVAMETLREMITEDEFRRYLKYGFILVRGQSGDVYQVFRLRSHTKIWRKGKVVEEVCTRIKDTNIPPTDNVIAFKTMIETDEQEFKSIGNVYRMAA